VRFVKRRALLYLVAQIGGGLVGAAILQAINDVENDMLCAPRPALEPLAGTDLFVPVVGVGRVFGYEMLTTFVLVMTVHASCDTAREVGGSAPLAIGLSVSMCHLWAVRYIFGIVGRYT